MGSCLLPFHTKTSESGARFHFKALNHDTWHIYFFPTLWNARTGISLLFLLLQKITPCRWTWALQLSHPASSFWMPAFSTARLGLRWVKTWGGSSGLQELRTVGKKWVNVYHLRVFPRLSQRVFGAPQCQRASQQSQCLNWVPKGNMCDSTGGSRYFRERSKMGKGQESGKREPC